MAEFRVDYSNGTSIVYSGLGSRYYLNDAQGVLTVYDGKGDRFRFSPSSWQAIQEVDPQHDEFVTHPMD